MNTTLLTILTLIAASKGKTENGNDIAKEFEHQLLPETVGNGGIVDALSHWAYSILDLFGFHHNPTLALVLYSVIVLAAAVAIGIFCRWILLWIGRTLVSKSKSIFAQVIHTSHFLNRLAALVPPLAYLVFLHLTYLAEAHLTQVLSKITIIYIIIVSVLAATGFVKVVWTYIDKRQNKRKLPLKGIAQLVNGIICIIATIIAVAILVNRSPATLLAGLGAFAAVLMLVFKDSILGVVASVQLSNEDALHVGDWIVVNGTNANGTVKEVNLSSVKVLNWDNTTTMLPPYSLISGSFTNYRSMQETGARRIYRNYLIDADSVRHLVDSDLDRYRDIPFMNEWINAKQQQKRRGILAADPKLAFGSLETNLGLLRAYMKMYLDNNPDVDHSQLCMVSTDQQSSNGIPLFIYCFSATSSWAPYLAVQAEIFEHLAVMLQRFDLCVFEAPSGRDTIAEGVASTHPDADLFGAPEPMYYSQLTGLQSKPVPVSFSSQKRVPTSDKQP